MIFQPPPIQREGERESIVIASNPMDGYSPFRIPGRKTANAHRSLATHILLAKWIRNFFLFFSRYALYTMFISVIACLFISKESVHGENFFCVIITTTAKPPTKHKRRLLFEWKSYDTQFYYSSGSLCLCCVLRCIDTKH